MSKIRMKPGSHEAVFAATKEWFSGASEADIMCIVSFDECSNATIATSFDKQLHPNEAL